MTMRQRSLKKEFCMKTNYEACARRNEMKMGIVVITRKKKGLERNVRERTKEWRREGNWNTLTIIQYNIMYIYIVAIEIIQQIALQIRFIG